MCFDVWSKWIDEAKQTRMHQANINKQLDHETRERHREERNRETEIDSELDKTRDWDNDEWEGERKREIETDRKEI